MHRYLAWSIGLTGEKVKTVLLAVSRRICFSCCTFFPFVHSVFDEVTFVVISLYIIQPLSGALEADRGGCCVP